jgi:zona occludens toxin
LLPWYKNTWTEFRHDAETNGKSISHYSGSPKRYKANKAYFECYQSTATGTAQASNENISVFRDPKLRLMLIIIFCCVAFLVYQLNAAFHRVSAKAPVSSASVDQSSASAVVDVPSNVPVDSLSSKAISPAPVSINPFQNAVFYYVGSINNQLLFEVAMGKITLNVSYDELRLMGYFIEKKSSNIVILKHENSIVYALPKPRIVPNAFGGELVEPNRTQEGAILGNSQSI